MIAVSALGIQAPEHDIGDRDDISVLVEEFYRCVFADDLLGPVFVDIAKVDLSAHLPKMCDFWETALFRTGSYHGNVMIRHSELNQKAALTTEHFDRWLQIWWAVVDRRYAGPVAERAKLMGTRVARGMARRILGAADYEPARATAFSSDAAGSAPERLGSLARMR